ncbi:MAG: FKBP-type peptidyl-prolyl cis-trans isomerase [Balneolaceae bacterium]
MKNPLLLFPFILLFTGCINSTENRYDDTADLAFLEENAQRDGVTVTDSGLQYRVIEEGEGDSPTAESVVFTDYVIRLVNDESAEQSEFFRLDQVFEGLSEGLQLMSTGAVYELVLPTELVNNDGRVVIYEIELTSFLMDPDEFLEQNAQEEGVEVTDSGLQYRVIEEGDGDQPGPGSTVRVHYKGSFTNGEVFDESGSNPAQFSVAGVIDGFGEGLQLMQEGATYELFVPADLGYGEDRPSLGNVLIFEVELVEVL